MTTKVRAEEEAVNELRRAAVEKHGKLYGKLKDETTRALRLHAKRLRAEKEEDGG